MKHCNKCGEENQGAFHASRKTICKPCDSARNKAWRLANPASEVLDKKCKTCGEDDREAFNASRSTLCKQCDSVRGKAWYLANPASEVLDKKCTKCGEDDQRAFSPTKKTFCKPCASAASMAWSLANPESQAARSKKWRQDYPEKCAAHTAQRRAAKLKRTPVWHETEKVNQLYAHCAFLSEITGEKHEVDHIIPLQGENVSGFHVWGNLQILPKRIHKFKGNAFNIEEYNA